MVTYLLAIDIGTTSTKILAVSTLGQVWAKVDRPNRTAHPQPGWAEQDPEQILKGILEGIAEIVTTVGTPPLVVCFSCAMHSLIAIDHSGKALTQAILWSDSRSQKQAEQLKASEQAKSIYRHTGTPIHAMSPLCKLIWFRENQPEILKKTACFIDIKGYVLSRFFGKYLIDYSLASATGLFSLQQNNWYAPALAIAGINTSQLPEAAPTNQQLSGLKLGIAQKTGLDAQTSFVIGASDGCLANLGALAHDGSALAITLGTSGAVRLGSNRPFLHPEGKTFSYHLDPHFFINGGATNNGGNVFTWIQHALFGGRELEKVLGQLEAVPPGANGLLALPWLYGERAPLWEEQATGAFIGLRPNHRPEHLGRAILEGLVLNLYSIFEDLTSIPGLVVREIRINGGVANSSLVRQIIADVFDLPVHLLKGTDGSALGAAMMAMQAKGWIADYQELHSWIATTSKTEPIPANHRLYQERYRLMQTITPALLPVMRKLEAGDL